jgi:uncharacterized integral membrane protein (TIGR00698 family)
MVAQGTDELPKTLARLAPGVVLAAAVAGAALLTEPVLARITGGRTLPAMVLALLVGILLNGVARAARFEPGLTWCVKKLLRIAIGLLGLRIAFGDILGLGFGTVALVIAAMVLTVASGFWLARWLGREAGYGALAGAATAVCGASATLATTTVVPPYANKAADTAFTVVMANAISTVVMLLYPPLCVWLGLSAQQTGVLLGATIHDMAQVVGAAYAISEPVGNTATVVKLFRVFLLLPVVLAIGWWFLREGKATGEAKVPVPVFALAFLALAAVNSIALAVPQLQPAYLPVKALLGHVSSLGLLLAIAALGLGTSLTAILSIGWRHVAVFMGATVVILAIVTAGVIALG